MYGRENDFTEMHPGKLAYYDVAPVKSQIKKGYKVISKKV